MSKISTIVARAWYGLLHRVHPAHKYNTIKMKSLAPGYYDPDVRMLHACFDLFEEWFTYNVIKEKLMDRDSMNSSYEGTYEELMVLYLWWTVERPEKELTNDTIADFDAFEEKDDEMLMRLIKIRRTIWYL